MGDELARGGPPAGPAFSVRIGAGLIELGRVDADEADAPAPDVDGVAVDHPRAAADERMWLGIERPIELPGDEAGNDGKRDPQVGIAAPPCPAGAPCRSSSPRDARTASTTCC